MVTIRVSGLLLVGSLLAAVGVGEVRGDHLLVHRDSGRFFVLLDPPKGGPQVKGFGLQYLDRLRGPLPERISLAEARCPVAYIWPAEGFPRDKWPSGKRPVIPYKPEEWGRPEYLHPVSPAKVDRWYLMCGSLKLSALGGPHFEADVPRIVQAVPHESGKGYRYLLAPFARPFDGQGGSDWAVGVYFEGSLVPRPAFHYGSGGGSNGVFIPDQVQRDTQNAFRAFLFDVVAAPGGRNFYIRNDLRGYLRVREATDSSALVQLDAKRDPRDDRPYRMERFRYSDQPRQAGQPLANEHGADSQVIESYVVTARRHQFLAGPAGVAVGRDGKVQDWRIGVAHRRPDDNGLVDPGLFQIIADGYKDKKPLVFLRHARTTQYLSGPDSVGEGTPVDLKLRERSRGGADAAKEQFRLDWPLRFQLFVDPKNGFKSFRHENSGRFLRVVGEEPDGVLGFGKALEVAEDGTVRFPVDEAEKLAYQFAFLELDPVAPPPKVREYSPEEEERRWQRESDAMRRRGIELQRP